MAKAPTKSSKILSSSQKSSSFNKKSASVTSKSSQKTPLTKKVTGKPSPAASVSVGNKKKLQPQKGNVSLNKASSSAAAQALSSAKGAVKNGALVKAPPPAAIKGSGKSGGATMPVKKAPSSASSVSSMSNQGNIKKSTAMPQSKAIISAGKNSIPQALAKDKKTPVIETSKTSKKESFEENLSLKKDLSKISSQKASSSSSDNAKKSGEKEASAAALSKKATPATSPSKTSKAPKKPVEEVLEDVFDDGDLGDSEIEEYEEELAIVEESLEKEDLVEEEEAVPPSDPSSEEVVLTDAEGRRYCRARDCDQVSLVEAYCRYHYLLFWKKIQNRKKILVDGKLERYIEELTARYPDKFLEMIRRDLRSEKDFLAAIQEMEIDESAGENEFEEDSSSFLDEVRGLGDASSGVEEDEF